MSETCTIVITMNDYLDNYREEDIVKNLWGYLYPWFTRRQGVERGEVSLNDGAVKVSWEYRSTDDGSGGGGGGEIIITEQGL